MNDFLMNGKIGTWMLRFAQRKSEKGRMFFMFPTWTIESYCMLNINEVKTFYNYTPHKHCLHYIKARRKWESSYGKLDTIEMENLR